MLWEVAHGARATQLKWEIETVLLRRRFEDDLLLPHDNETRVTDICCMQLVVL